MHVGLITKDFAVGRAFNSNGLPSKSGAEFHAENHARELMRLGHRVTIFAKKRYFATKAREDVNGIDLVRLHEPSRGAELLLRLRTTHRDVDALYIIGIPAFAVWAIWLARKKGIPVTLALTAKMEIFDGDANWRNRLFASCDHYIATTHEIAAGYTARGGIAPERVTVLPHGIDAQRFSVPTAEERALLRARLGIAEDAHVLLFLARIVLNKGVDTLQDVWRIIHAHCKEARLLVVGGGLPELMLALRSLGAETDGSVIVTGEQAHPEDYYRAADCYIFPSRHEALPTSLIEAISSGLPAVVSDIGGCDDLVQNGVNGYRVPVEDADAYAARILEIFENPEKGAHMGACGRRLVKTRLDYAVLSDQLAAIIAQGDNTLGTRDFLQW